MMSNHAVRISLNIAKGAAVANQKLRRDASAQQVSRTLVSDFAGLEDR